MLSNIAILQVKLLLKKCVTKRETAKSIFFCGILKKRKIVNTGAKHVKKKSPINISVHVHGFDFFPSVFQLTRMLYYPPKLIKKWYCVYKYDLERTATF